MGRAPPRCLRRSLRLATLTPGVKQDGTRPAVLVPPCPYTCPQPADDRMVAPPRNQWHSRLTPRRCQRVPALPAAVVLITLAVSHAGPFKNNVFLICFMYALGFFGRRQLCEKAGVTLCANVLEAARGFYSAR
ncbi:hypothetical protein BV25DRAFT_1833049 [Artomyces pyxidatus]|uniref:Uncharacterized protein n=1 Tax=Artomyces pyxidatus TaxID=48021 RepID=A0ACB8SGM6_9AGAM|nr:hypothetical protein BV25DRAFT_1833049 [Artomyces pyxidatus]